MDKVMGKRLDGRYEITDLIGVGGMANVYKANDLLEGRVVAVKVLREEFLDNEELVRRFKNESKAIGLLSHPNIVRVFDVNFSETVQYIVMEFIDGITLKQYIDAVKPLGWKDAVHFIVQILRALQHAHDRGIVHRDIKPQNIMLLEDGSIKVMDFGIARFSRSETRTITDKAIGSVHYISPEQAKGDITDSKADIYSVGIMMYEMLTGTLPFESDTPVQVAIKQISDEPVYPREIVGDIPEGLEEITIKAMTKDSSLRYQSASQMLRDIDDFKKNPGIIFQYKYFGAAATQRAERETGRLDPRERIDRGAHPDFQRRPPQKRRGKKRPKISSYLIIGVVTACILCTLVLVLYMTDSLGPKNPDVDLLDFRGMKYEDILEKAQSDPDYMFDFDPVEDYSSKPIGEVYDQKPLPPKKVKSGSKVTLYISRGPSEVTLPDVTGMASGEARQILSNLGLTVRQETITDLNYEPNVVVMMTPEAGTVVEGGGTVTIVVNVHPGGSIAVVPDVVGMTLTEAQAELTKNNLRRGTVTREPSDKPKDTIIKQGFPPGSKVDSATPIDLVLSDGPAVKNYTLKIILPNSPDGTAYTVKITVNGKTVYTQNYTNSTTLVYTVAVDKPNTVIKVMINSYEYASFSVSNAEPGRDLEAGSTTWPYGAAKLPDVMPFDRQQRRRLR